MTVGMRNRVRRLESGVLSPKRFYPGQPFEEIVSQLAHFEEIGDLRGLLEYLSRLPSDERERIIERLKRAVDETGPSLFEGVSVHHTFLGQMRRERERLQVERASRTET